MEFRSFCLATIVVFSLFFTIAASALESTTPDTGNGEAEHWDLSDLYATPEAWEQSYTSTLQDISALEELNKTINQNPRAMFETLQALSDTLKEVYRLYVYASLNTDEDQRQAEPQERFARAQILYAEYGKNTSWLNPKILSIGEKKTNGSSTLRNYMRKSHVFPLLAETEPPRSAQRRRLSFGYYH